VPNVGTVVGGRAALVIDTGLGRRNGAYVLEQARRLAVDRPLYLTITHTTPARQPEPPRSARRVAECRLSRDRGGR
jgi:hypothetical protein